MLRFLWVAMLWVSAHAGSPSAVVDVTLSPAGSFRAKSTQISGTAVQLGTAVAAKNIVVGLKNLETDNSLRNTHAKKYLQVDKYPTAILISAKGKNGKGTGVIRIKGITKAISGTFTIDKDMLTAKFPLKLSDFKIDGIKYMGAGVDDDINLTVTVPVKKISRKKTAAP